MTVSENSFGTSTKCHRCDDSNSDYPCTCTSFDDSVSFELLAGDDEDYVCMEEDDSLDSTNGSRGESDVSSHESRNRKISLDTTRAAAIRGWMAEGVAQAAASHEADQGDGKLASVTTEDSDSKEDTTRAVSQRNVQDCTVQTDPTGSPFEQESSSPAIIETTNKTMSSTSNTNVQEKSQENINALASTLADIVPNGATSKSGFLVINFVEGKTANCRKLSCPHVSRCIANKKKGGQCINAPVAGTAYCRNHAHWANEAANSVAAVSPPPFAEKDIPRPSSAPHVSRCIANKKRGGQCIDAPVPGTAYCRNHANSANKPANHMTAVRCSGVTENGNQCKDTAKKGSLFCGRHASPQIAATNLPFRCIGITEQGTQCKNTAVKGTSHCGKHSRPSNASAATQCIGTTVRGTRCQDRAKTGSAHCTKHSPSSRTPAVKVVARCSVLTERGKLCSNDVRRGSTYCGRHSRSSVKRIVQCSGITENGSQCKDTAKQGKAYCGRHLASAKAPAVKTIVQCSGITERGTRCKDTAKKGLAFCGRHLRTPPKSPAARTIVQCAAITESGIQCKDTAKQGSPYCGRHLLPSNAPVIKTIIRCSGITETGIQCRYTAKQGSAYCGRHIRPLEAPAAKSIAQYNGAKANGTQCKDEAPVTKTIDQPFGVTKTDTQCNDTEKQGPEYHGRHPLVNLTDEEAELDDYFDSIPLEPALSYPSFEESFDNFVYITNLPKVPEVEKLTKVVTKLVARIGKLATCLDTGYTGIRMPIDQENGGTQGFCYVEFETVEDAKTAVNVLDGYEFGKNRLNNYLRVSPFSTEIEAYLGHSVLLDQWSSFPRLKQSLDNFIVVTNLPKGRDKVKIFKLCKVIEKLFSRVGSLASCPANGYKGVEMLFDHDKGYTFGFCYVEFKTAADAKLAAKILDGSKFDENHSLKVTSLAHALSVNSDAESEPESLFSKALTSKTVVQCNGVSQRGTQAGEKLGGMERIRGETRNELNRIHREYLKGRASIRRDALDGLRNGKCTFSILGNIKEGLWKVERGRMKAEVEWIGFVERLARAAPE